MYLLYNSYSVAFLNNLSISNKNSSTVFFLNILNLKYICYIIDVIIFIDMNVGALDRILFFFIFLIALR